MNILTRFVMDTAKHTIEKFIKDNFDSESFGGKSWKRRKSKDKSDRRNSANRRLLTKSRRLERSLRLSVSGNRVLVKSDTPYAKIHNEGGDVNHPGGTPYLPIGNTRSRSRQRISSMGNSQMVFLKKDGNYPQGTKFTKPHKITIPQRQFVGKHPKLAQQLKKDLKQVLRDEIKKALKSR